MKRENFEIKLNGQVVAIKHKWNSSIREIERQVKEIARQGGTVYSLVDSSSVKEGFEHVMGTRVWVSVAGVVQKFEVKKL